MRKSFEENLHQYNDISKDELALRNDKATPRGPEKDKELADLKTVLEWETKKDAQTRETSQAAQLEIYSLQRTKQDIFQKLERDLAALDNPDTAVRWESSATKVIAEGDKIFASSKDGTRSEITAGEMLTDGEWGIKYAPGESVPRNLRKKYLVETAKRKIRSRLNRQIYIDEIASKRTSEHVKGAYTRKFEEEELNGELRPGILAEKMMGGLLKKMSYIPGAEFEIIDSDVHLDVTRKIDFIIRRKSHYRGVGVEAAEHQDKGVQFTISANKERIAEKQHQLRRANTLLRPEDHLSEIVLVSVQIQHINDIYESWKANPTPGGPDKLWDKATKKDIFTRILAGMLSPTEIEEQWAKIEPQI